MTTSINTHNFVKRNRNTDKSILLFPVSLQSLQFKDPEFESSIFGDRGKAVIRTDKNTVVKAGLSSDYKLVTHSDVITAVEAVLDANNLKFQVHDCFLGGIRDGKMFLQYTLPDYKIDINKDAYTPFIQIHNSYDKSSLFKAVCGLFRIKCSNGLVLLQSTDVLLNAKHYGKTIDLSKLAFDLNTFLENLNIAKTKMTKLVEKIFEVDFLNDGLLKMTESILEKKKDQKAFEECGLVDAYVAELGLNQYALMNAFTDYVTHTLASRVTNYDRVLKSYSAIETIFLN